MTSTENFYKTFDHVRKCILNKLCIKKINPGQVTLRSDIKDFEEASVFVGAYEAVTCTNFKVCPSKEALNRSVRRRQWICTNRLLNNGPLEVPVKCPAKITVSFKKVTKYSKAKDPFLRRNPPFQAVIKIVPDHNHLLTASESVKQLKITSPLKECFYEYFKRGISGASAKSFHEQNLQRVNFHALSDDSMNPSLPAIDILYQDWKRMMKIVSSKKGKITKIEYELQCVKEILMDLQSNQMYITKVIQQFDVKNKTLVMRDFKQIRSFEQLKAFDASLSESEKFTEMINYFGSFGGKDKHAATRKILSHLIANDLAMQLNWKGSGTKRSIQEFKHFVQLVIASVRHENMFKEATIGDIESCIARWLRYASDRDGGRTKRKPDY